MTQKLNFYDVFVEMEIEAVVVAEEPIEGADASNDSLKQFEITLGQK